LKLLAVVLALVPLACGGMHRVWEVRLDQRINEPVGHSTDLEHLVGSIAFSPDNARLAVTMDEHKAIEGVRARLVHLLVLDAAAPKKPFLQFDLDTCGADRELVWSPTGEAIYVCGTLIQLAGGQMCHPARVMDGFIDGQHYLRQEPWPAPPPNAATVRTTFSVENFNCVPDGTWSLEGAQSLTRLETHRQVALVSTVAWRYIPAMKRSAWLETRPPTPLTLLDLATHQPLPSWSSRNVPDGVFFLSEGASLCAPQTTGIRCWDLDTAREIATVPMKNESLWHAFDRFPASASTRLLTQHFTHIPILPIFQDDIASDYPGKMKVWDIRSGRQIASWNPEKQRFIAANGVHASTFDPVALSPDGHLVAEGGNGVVRLYRID
jgi:WD40 repeat protein